MWKDNINMVYIYLFIYISDRASSYTFVVGNQLDAQFLLWYVYLNPLHVSSNSVLILRRTIVLIQLLV